MLLYKDFGLRLKRVLLAGAGAVGLLLMMVPAHEARAQVAYNGTTSSVASYSSSDSLSPLAVDASGDVFYVLNNGTTNTLYKVPSGGSPTVLNSAFPYMPSALAVNSAGTALYMIYSASSASCNGLTYQRVSMVSTAANSTPADLQQCFTNFGYNASYSDPTGLATDSSGNLYVADFGGGVIWELPATVSSSSHPTEMMDLTQQPYDIAVLGSTIYFTALNASSVDTLYSVSASNFTTGIPGGAAPSSANATIGSIQQGLAVDSNGNVYIGTSNSIQKYSGGSVSTYTSVPGGVTGLGVDSSNNLYFDGLDSSSNPFVGTFAAQAVNFGSVNVGATSGTNSLSFTIAASTTVGSVHIYTQGADGLDFVDAGSSTCTAKTYSTSTSCVVNVSFKPRSAGLRMGAVTMFDGSGNALVSAPVYGTGVGPQIGFAPAVQSNIGSGLNNPWGITVDGSGNVYIGDYNNNRVVKETLSGGSYTQSVFVSGLNQPAGAAVDGAGNVYIADASNNRVLMETLNAGSYTQSTIGTGLSVPYGVAVDGSGNVYIAEYGSSLVVKETLSGGSYTQSTIGSGLNHPTGVAVDSSGNVYIADLSNNRVLKETLSGASYTQSVIVSGLYSPSGVAVDGAGNVYIADRGNGRVLKEALSGGSYTQSVIVSGLNFPASVALDGSGNVFLSNSTNLLREDVVTPPSLTFISTTVGVQSSDSPQSVTVMNNGNAALTFPIPTSGNNPSIASGYQLGSGTTCPELTTSSSAGTLAAGASCVYAVSFIPVISGTDSGSLVLKDNNLNAAGPNYITQSISLTGTATSIAISPTSLPAATVAISYSQTITASGGTSPYTYSITTGSLPAGLSLNASTGVLSGAPTAGGTFAFSVSVTDSSSNTSSQSYTLTVSAPTITIAPATLPSATAFASYSQTLTASGGTASYTYAITSGALPAGMSLSSGGVLSGTPTAAGTFNFTVTATDSSTGTGPYTGSQSYSLTVSQATSTTTLTSSLNPSTYGQSITLTATVTPAPTATGEAITITDNGNALATVTLNSSGVATYTTSALAAGSHTLVANYAGDTAESASSGTLTQVVNKLSTTTNLTSSLNPSTYGQSVTLTATVTASTGTPTGTVTFMDGSVVLGSATLNGSGIATYTSGAFSAGTHALTAVYAGDTNYTTSTSASLSQVVNAAATTTALTSSLNPSTYGQSVTFTATVTSSAGTPTGTVTFTNNGAPLGTGTLSAGGVATFTTSTLTAGAHTVTAVYSGSTNYATSTSSGLAQTVNPASTTTAVVSSANPSTYGQSVTFTATVHSSTGGTPTGTVTFTSNGATLGAATLNASGIATYTTSALTAGSDAITAAYSATTNYSTSSGALAQTVNPSALTVTANNATRVYGTANPAFSGTVTGAVNGDTFTESFSTTATMTSNVGTYPIVPTATGTNLSDYTVTTQNGTLTITKAGSNTAMSVSSSSVTPGQSVTLTATVTSATSGTPTGAVSFYDGTTLLGTGTLTGGVASLSTTALTAGTTNVLTASYGGDVNFLPSSTTASVPVTVASLDFTFTVTGPASQTVVPGSAVSYQAVIDPLYGSFPGPVNFSVAGLPPGATYTVSPSTIDANAGKQNVVLSIQTAPTTAKQSAPPIGRRMAPLALALLLLPLAGARRMRRQGRRLGQMLCLVLLFGGLAMAVTGCGSANGFFAQAQKSYDVTITATAGGLQHSATVSVEVQ